MHQGHRKTTSFTKCRVTVENIQFYHPRDTDFPEAFLSLQKYPVSIEKRFVLTFACGWPRLAMTPGDFSTYLISRFWIPLNVRIAPRSSENAIHCISIFLPFNRDSTPPLRNAYVSPECGTFLGKRFPGPRKQGGLSPATLTHRLLVGTLSPHRPLFALRLPPSNLSCPAPAASQNSL